MARAETIESAGEPGGGNGCLPSHNICRLELSRSLHTWPGLLSTNTITAITGPGTGAIHLHPHHLHPLQPLLQPYLLPEQQLPALSPSSAPPPPLQRCSQRDGREGGPVNPSASSGAESDLDLEERQEASNQQPLPDLLPRSERSPWSSPYPRDPRTEAEQELEVRRVARQLRAFGDQYNTTILRRAHIAPHWEDWRDACRGLLYFITRALSALYRLT